ncbi:MAG: hypothetical protein K0S56_92 [Microvirga sp.]|jgi:hypothetical protein|nr:hypothetical protein [Microvirga sp.]
MNVSPDISSLVLSLSSYFVQFGGRLDQIYHWKIPADVPCSQFERGTDSLAQANKRLKRALSNAWAADIGSRLELATWFVATWGGVRTNHRGTLQTYVNTSQEELAVHPIDGVATWSKILAMRNPTKYSIYDARVGAAVNALQTVMKADRPIIFPSVPSRTTKIVPFQRQLRNLPGHAIKVPRHSAYRYYGELFPAPHLDWA